MISKEPLNVCIFCGRLTEYVTTIVGDGQYVLGKGILLLPPEDNITSNKGQRIRLVAWQEKAERLKEIPIDSWIKVLCTYSPEYYGNTLYDNFTIGSFSVL